MEQEVAVSGFVALMLPFDISMEMSEMMFHACFAVLGKFVEEQLGPPLRRGDKRYRGYRLHRDSSAEQRAIDLWLWYTEELPALKTYGELDRLKDQKFRELVALRYALST